MPTDQLMHHARRLPATLLTVCLSLTATSALAGTIYRSVDEHGNVSFSDREPSRNGSSSKPVETIELSDANSYASSSQPRPAYEPNRGNGSADGMYQVMITSPADNASLRDNAGNIAIGTRVIPELSPGHRLVLQLDGKLTQIEPDGTEILLSNVSRGTHNFRLVVVDRRGSELAASNSQKFHLQRYAPILAPNGRPRPRPPATTPKPPAPPASPPRASVGG